MKWYRIDALWLESGATTMGRSHYLTHEAAQKWADKLNQIWSGKVFYLVEEQTTPPWGFSAEKGEEAGAYVQ